MEKYGCNREEEIVNRIKELEDCLDKTASQNDEVVNLKEALVEIAKEKNETV